MAEGWGEAKHLLFLTAGYQTCLGLLFVVLGWSLEALPWEVEVIG